ncbi:MAG TPA: SHOCT domain-containing protein [Pseudogracilibacillus sp.]|nr:SHOCT domain-containing protein [Pseudogracilibacillus sp.]
MMHGMYGYGPVWMFVLWIILILFGIYLLIKFIKGDKQHPKNDYQTNNNQKTPLYTLQDRLAKGEIDEAEYERLKLILERDRG